MLLYEFYNDSKKGMLKRGMDIKEVRKIVKSNFIICEASEYEDKNDYYRSIGLIIFYDKKNKLNGINIVDRYSEFYYKKFNLFCKYVELKKFLGEKKILYIADETGIEIENKGIGIYIPDIDVEEPDEEYGPVIVKTINVDFEALDCSISFERLISNHIPAKISFENSKISSGKGPAIRMNYDDQKYFASHGKSHRTLRFLEAQKERVQAGKVMEAIKKDIEDIKGKTSSKYSIALKEMSDYARTLKPKDFIIQKEGTRI